MLTAVWVAVIVAVAFWAIGVCAAVYLMMRAARLIDESTAAVTSLRERGDVLAERATATLDRAGEQLARTDAITASMDEVTASMAELSGRVAALAPLARMIASSAGSPLTRVASVVYGVNRALGARRGGQRARSRPVSGSPGRARLLPRTPDPGTPGAGTPGRGRRAALTGRRGGPS